MRTVFLTVAAALLLAAPAQAQIVIGSGAVPGVAVDSAGTAHIAYNGVEAGQPPHYCRLPRGATACDVALTLPVTPTTDTLSRPVVTVAGTRITVVVHRYGEQTAISRYTSTNGGLSFAAPAVAGGHVPNVESVVGPGDTVSVVSFTETAGALFQNVPLAGGTAGPVATLFDGTRPYNGTVGLIDAATPLAIFATGTGNGAFRRYAGTGDINNAAQLDRAGRHRLRRLPAPGRRAGRPVPDRRRRELRPVRARVQRHDVRTPRSDHRERRRQRDAHVPGRGGAAARGLPQWTGRRLARRPCGLRRRCQLAVGNRCRCRPTTSRVRCASPPRPTTSASRSGAAAR